MTDDLDALLPAQKTSTDPNIDKRVHGEVIDILFLQGHGAVLGSIFAGTCVYLVLRTDTNTIAINLFYCLIWIVAALRYMLVVSYQQIKPSIELKQRWHVAFFILTMLSAFVWIMPGTILFPANLSEQTFIAFCIAGMSAGALPFFAPSKYTGIMFTGTVLLSFGIYLIVHEPGALYKLIGFMSFFYMFVHIKTIVRINNALYRTVKYKLQNEDLINDLSDAKELLESLNNSLESEVIDRVAAEKSVRAAEEQYRLVTDALPVLISYITKNFIYQYNNKAYESWYGKSLNHITHHSVEEILEQAEYNLLLEYFPRLENGETVTYETVMYSVTNKENFVSVNLIPHLEGEKLKGFFSLISDMTPRINYLASHDILTGLPNRSLFNARLPHSIRKMESLNSSMALIFLDLDNFKEVNDTLGHDTGDMLLIKAIERFQIVLDKHDLIARFGGDEFIILIENANYLDEVIRKVENLIKCTQEEFLIDDQNIFVTVSIGVSFYPQDGTDPQSLLRNADIAMYYAKSSGKNTYQIFTEQMKNLVQRSTQIEQCLRRHLENNEIEVYYQPIIDIHQNKIIGFEALSRLGEIDSAAMSTIEFIRVAEKTGLIMQMGEKILRTACSQLKKWHESGHSQLKITVNLSAKQISPQFEKIVIDVLRETKLDGRFLVLEITESELMEDKEKSLTFLHALKKHRISFAIDDFGTGYSSLSYLKEFPFNIIKMDKSFITDFVRNPHDAAIVKAIIVITQTLQMKTVAEGVETEEQYEFLKNHGCDSVQGYYFYRPLAAHAIDVILKDSFLGGGHI